MARTLPADDRDWLETDPREEPPERVSLPAWSCLALVFALAFWLRGPLATLLDGPAVATWTTIFVSISVQALPFLVLGVVLSGAITALVPPGWLARALPKRPLVAVPAAGLAGVVLPGCECGAVPIAGRLTARGVPPAAAFAFMLAAPAINPVVLVSTAVAFPGRPEMVGARFVASLATAVTVGLLRTRLVFMVVGPVVDLKLIALQTGVFGRRFALRLSPLTLAVAIGSGCAVGWWLL